MRSLYLVAGYAGSGKSTFSKILSVELNAVLIDKDDLLNPFVEVLNESLCLDKDDRHSQKHNEIVRQAQYDCLDSPNKAQEAPSVREGRNEPTFLTFR